MKTFTIIIMTVCLIFGLTTGLNADVASTITVNPGDDVQTAVDNYDVVYFNPGTYDFSDVQLLIRNSTKLIGISDHSGKKPTIKGEGNHYLPPSLPDWHGSPVGIAAYGHEVEINNIRIEASESIFNSSALYYGAGQSLHVNDCEIMALDCNAGVYIGFSNPGDLGGDVVVKDTTIYHYATTPIPAAGYWLVSPQGDLILALSEAASLESNAILITESASPFDSIEFSHLTIHGPNVVNGNISETIGLNLRGGCDENTTTVIDNNLIISDGYPLIMNPYKGRLTILRNELECNGYYRDQWASGIVVTGHQNGFISQNTINMNLPFDEGEMAVGVQLGAGFTNSGCSNKMFNQNVVTGMVDWMVWTNADFVPGRVIANNVFKNFDRSEMIVSNRLVFGSLPATEYMFWGVYWDPELYNNYDNVLIDNAPGGSVKINGSFYPGIWDPTDNPATEYYDGANIVKGRLRHIYIEPPGQM